MGYTGEGMDLTGMMKQAAELDPEKYQFLIDAAEELKNSPFLEETIQRQNEILSSAQEKIASSIWTRNSLGGHMARGAAAVAGTTAAGIGYELLSDLYNDTKGALTKDRNLKKMIEKNPDLEEYDQEKVKSIFTTLHNFAGPKFSADPNISGTFVRNQVALHQGMPQGVDMGAINQLISARGTHDKGRDLKIPNSIPGIDVHKHMLDIQKSDAESGRRETERSKLTLDREKHEYEKKRNQDEDQIQGARRGLEQDMTKWKHQMESDRFKAWGDWTAKAEEAEKAGRPAPAMPAILAGSHNRGSGGPPGKRGRK
jgi:hypothetical protein